MVHQNMRRKVVIYGIVVYGICTFMLWHNLQDHMTLQEKLSNLSKVHMNISVGENTRTVSLYTETYIQRRNRSSDEPVHHILVIISHALDHSLCM